MRRRYIQLDGELQEIDRDYAQDPVAPMIMPDIQPYRSMVDGSLIGSRSHHRAHLKQHGCVEVGNDSSLSKRREALRSPPGLKDKIIRAVNEVERRR